MRIKGFQKYFFLLVLSFEIAQGSFAFASKTDIASTKKSTTLQSVHHQSDYSDFTLIEETDDNDSDDTQHNLVFIVPSTNDFTFHILRHETILFQNFSSSNTLHNQKINILNCSFLI